jgi:integrase/recombinase XerD
MTARTSLRDALVDYLAMRRAVGFKLHSTGRLLGQFVEHLEACGIDTITTEEALAWAALPVGASPHWVAIRLSAVRGFARYLQGVDPSVEVPPTGIVRVGSDRATPYLYSPTEIVSLMTAASELHPPLRAATYETLIGLLVTTGVRIGEAISFDDADFDRSEELLVVRNSKFGKSRLVPLHPTTATALTSYVVRRRQLCPSPSSPALFVSSRGTRLLHSNIQLTFTGLLTKVGIVRRSKSCRPRIHDARHTFTVQSLLDCYERGDDAAVLLAKLAPYLGHADPKNSFWYLSAAPELMAFAGQRLESHQGART